MRHFVARLLKRAGYHARRLDDGAWLVHDRRVRPPLGVRELSRATWLVEGRRRKRQVRQIGPRAARTDLLVDRKASREHMQPVQRALSGYLSEEQLVWILDRLGINCVLDVGANIGQFGHRIRDGGYTGRIVSFEPVPRYAEKLRETADADHDWQVHQCALGDETGTATINVTPGPLSSLLEPSEFGREWSDKLNDVTQEEIEIRRLEDVLDDAGAGIENPRYFLKLDTQGFDLQAFRGAGDRIKDILGMQSEVACLTLYAGMPRLPEVLAEYEAAGFEISGLFPITRDRHTLRVIEFDAMLVRADAFAAD
jgi:FkbM family methyltransferase